MSNIERKIYLTWMLIEGLRMDGHFGSDADKYREVTELIAEAYFFKTNKFSLREANQINRAYHQLFDKIEGINSDPIMLHTMVLELAEENLRFVKDPKKISAWTEIIEIIKTTNAYKELSRNPDKIKTKWVEQSFDTGLFIAEAVSL